MNKGPNIEWADSVLTGLYGPDHATPPEVLADEADRLIEAIGEFEERVVGENGIVSASAVGAVIARYFGSTRVLERLGADHEGPHPTGEIVRFAKLEREAALMTKGGAIAERAFRAPRHINGDDYHDLDAAAIAPELAALDGALDALWRAGGPPTSGMGTRPAPRGAGDRPAGQAHPLFRLAEGRSR